VSGVVPAEVPTEVPAEVPAEALPQISPIPTRASIPTRTISIAEK
jgi:hypothetical protein